MLLYLTKFQKIKETFMYEINDLFRFPLRSLKPLYIMPLNQLNFVHGHKVYFIVVNTIIENWNTN